MFVRIVALYFILAVLVACQSTALYTNKPSPTHTPPKAQVTHSATENVPRPGSAEYMVSSWYGNPYHGRQTASGEVFNMYDFTAAHRSLPFGTRLRLINESNGKETVVRINDRGPVPLDRDIDVSYKVADVLGFLNAGICRLRVIYLD